ncbi:uncharacterized protein LOC134254313 [Saccostrea cucullata]|uniref:uncharacterized protein LOC134254313 n=1 Tax=Saccostrea cuccullata TaxID=36930 RepID=UPI002ED3919A
MCPQGYTFYRTSVFTTCLKYVSTEVNYKEAVSSCKQDGGDLIRIDSQEKFDIFKNHAGQYASSTAIEVWVQGEKINGQWKFHDGTLIPDFCPFVETNAPGEVHIRSSSDLDYKCVDMLESRLFHYMCEIQHY